MVLKPCFPDLPGGGCWPRDPTDSLRGCFPIPARQPASLGRAPHNKRLQLPGAILKEVMRFVGDKDIARS
jgi:hypothetical protein